MVVSASNDAAPQCVTAVQDLTLHVWRSSHQREPLWLGSQALNLPSLHPFSSFGGCPQPVTAKIIQGVASSAVESGEMTARTDPASDQSMRPALTMYHQLHRYSSPFDGLYPERRTDLALIERSSKPSPGAE